MAKANSPNNRGTGKKLATGPTELVLSLYAPQMDALLRAGVGGLAAVLNYLEEEAKSGKATDEFPGGPWNDGKPPWKIESDRVTLEFGNPENAGEYLKRLFEQAFQIETSDNVIDLPATYRIQDRMVRAYLQRGLMLTFLQHGQSRTGAKSDTDKMFLDGDRQLPYTFRELTGYKHQNGFDDLVDKKTGSLTEKAIEIPGTLYPGASVRHNKFNSHTKHEGTTAELLAAYFALIGTIALPVNRGSAVLLVPEVIDLIEFAKKRWKMTPQNYQQCLIGGVGDAVLSVYANIVGTEKQHVLKVPSISAYLFQPTAWASQQKSRVQGVRIQQLSERDETIFDYARDFFRARIQMKVEKVTEGKGKSKTVREIRQPFWSISIVKPLIADNLANRRPWFHDFSSLFTRNDPATGKPLRNRLFFEREGLAKMVNSDVWDDEGQKSLVKSIQFALQGRFGEISRQYSGNPQGMKNKFQKEFEKWRIQFVSSKTADQFRFAVCDLMSRSRGNKEIQENWQQVLPLLSEQNWQYGRDLALLALASYQGKGDREAVDAPTTEEEVAITND